MNISHLQTTSMVNVSSRWINPALDRSLIASFERGKALLPRIDAAHQGLLGAQRDGGSVSAIDAKITQVQGVAQASDAAFVDLTRGVHYTLTGAALLVNDPVVVSQCELVRERLFPHGTAIVNWKYSEKAGEVELAAVRRTPEVDQVLARIKLPDGSTLASAVDAWFAAGRALGESEHQKVQLEREREAAAASLVKGADVLQARRRWVRVAQALLDDVEDEGLPADVAERIVGGLKRAIERVATRHAADVADDDVAEESEAPEAKPVVVAPAAPANDTAPAARKTG